MDEQVNENIDGEQINNQENKMCEQNNNNQVQQNHEAQKIQNFTLPIPTKNPEEVFSSKLTTSMKVQNKQDEDNRSQTSQKSNSSIERKRKGSFLQRMSQKQQQQEQKLNEKKKADMKSVFLQNVDYKATKQELQLLFEDCGKIARVTILKDNYTNHPKGCAYISFQTQRGVERALHLSGITLRNRIIKVHRKRTNLPGVFKGKKDDISMNLLGMMQNLSRGGFRGRGRGRGR